MKSDLVVRNARLVDGRVVDVVIRSGRIETVSKDLGSAPSAGAIVIEAAGRLLTPSFVNAHLHLDKAYTLPLIDDRAIREYTGAGMAGARTAIESARAVKEQYRQDMLVPNVRRALHEAVRYGTLHIQAFADVDTAARHEGLQAVLAAREELRQVLEVTVVAFPQDGILRDPGAAELCEEALNLGADVVGGIPWIEQNEDDARAHVEWACELAARTGRRVAMLVDDAGDATLHTSQMLAEAMLRHGLSGQGTACHARATMLYSELELVRLIELANRAELSFVSDPHTGPLALPVDRFERAGVPVALGQDDIEDAYYPYGRNNMLEVAFLASHLLELRTGQDQLRLLDMVTTLAARAVGRFGHDLVPGATANLCVHESERLVDLLREHAAPRWVISRGRVVAENTSTTTFHQPVEVSA